MLLKVENTCVTLWILLSDGRYFLWMTGLSHVIVIVIEISWADLAIPIFLQRPEASEAYIFLGIQPHTSSTHIHALS